MGINLLQGDWIERLRELPAESHQCCVTSPPYWGLRDYGSPGQLGLEKTPEEYVAKMVDGFEEVWRVLKADGTLWLNLGDSYAVSGKGGNPGSNGHEKQRTNEGSQTTRDRRVRVPGLKPKDLIGIPWMVAFALRSAGWYLRCDVIWNKPNPMPESVTDRPTRAHEYIFLLSKSSKYYYDHEAIKDAPSPDLIKQIEDGYNGHAVKDYLGASVQDASATKGLIIDGYRKRIDKQRGHGRRHNGFNDKWDALTQAEQAMCGRNKRSVWTVAPANYKGFTERVVWVRQAGGRAGGTCGIVLPSCPERGGLFDLLSMVHDGGHVSVLPSRIADTCDRLSLVPKPDFAPIEQLRAYCFDGKSLDWLLRERFGIATGHNNGSHKTDLFVSTKLSCKTSAQRLSRIENMLVQRGWSAPDRDRLLNSTWPDEMDAHSLDRSPYYTGDMSLFSSGPVYGKRSEMQSHFATFPPTLIKPCILAGSKAGDTILDPFGGSGTTGAVALELGRKATLIELNPEYVQLIEARRNITAGLPL